MMKRILSLVAFLALNISACLAQSDVSFFLRSDSIRLSVMDTIADDLFRKVGHHGPAIENSYMALRIYFKKGCAIDVYNKTHACLELKDYGWYPNDQQIADGAGSDEYLVGKTTGLGGMSLWDGEKQILLAGTKGRRVEALKTKDGATLSMLVRGVEYKGELVDIKLTINVKDDSRIAEVVGECTSGQKVIFMSGVNYHEGESITSENGHIAVYGLHPAGVVKEPHALGAAVSFDKKWQSLDADKETSFLPIITKKAVKKAKVSIIATSEREDALNSEAKFLDFVRNMK